MKHITLALVAGGTLAASPAFAQDTTDPNAGATTEAGMETPADPNAPAMDPNAAASVDAGATVSAVGWSPSAIDRPYMRGKGAITAGADFSFLTLSFPDPVTGMSSSITVVYLTLSGSYGITDKISAGALYSLSFGLGDGDFEAVGPLDLWAGFQISHSPKLSVAATADFAINLDNTDDKAIHAGLGVKYLLTPKVALFTGNAYGPGPVGNHLSISLATDGPITFDIPVGGMFQATPQLNIFARTALARIAISNAGDSTFFGKDYIPLGLGGLFNLNKNLDIAAAFDLFDVKEVGFDLYTFTAGVRWYN